MSDYDLHTYNGTILIRFYEELNDFLPKWKRKSDIEFQLTSRRSVKDLIESLGVPHVEVDLILANGDSVDFSYIVKPDDRLSVYPVFEGLDIHNVTRLRPRPLRHITFVLDVHLRALARRLRFMGFDTDYAEHRDDVELARISSVEKRVLLTRDKQLLMRRNVDRGLYVRNTDPDKQLIEILERLDLWRVTKPFSRCIKCNGHIEVYSDKDIDKIPPGVRSWCSEFFQCNSCKKIFWKGSHYDKLEARLERVKAAQRDIEN